MPPQVFPFCRGLLVHLPSRRISVLERASSAWSVDATTRLSFQGQGFRDLYNNVYDRVDPFVQAFGTLVLTY